ANVRNDGDSLRVMAGLVPAIHVFDSTRDSRRGCPRRQIYAACASLAASAGMTSQRLRRLVLVQVTRPVALIAPLPTLRTLTSLPPPRPAGCASRGGCGSPR